MMFALYCRLGVHVGASDRAVIRATRARLVPYTRARQEPRKALYRAMLAEHLDARALYRMATGGIS